MSNKDLIFFGVIFLNILFIIFTLCYVITNKNAFTQNPLLFGAKRVGGIDCICKRVENGVMTLNFGFNETSMYPIKDFMQKEINLTDFRLMLDKLGGLNGT